MSVQPEDRSVSPSSAAELPTVWVEASSSPTVPPSQQTASCPSCGRPLDDGTRLSAPEGFLTGYDFLGELGHGGMGVVYKARQVGLNRLVALKMIRAGAQASRSELARFKAEAEAVARLQHPNIVEIHEVGVQQGLPFFSLEFLEGGSLADRLRNGPLEPGLAAQLVEVLARAMHVAHQAGIVHRDLKPANVLLGRKPTEEELRAGTLPLGVPKITDFGLAKDLAQQGQTHSGDVLGTPSYMAPEQAAGKLRAIDARTDIYALGAILYECLTGRPPFRGATVLDTLEQVRKQEPVPVRQLQPKVPRDLETVCLKCLHKEPVRRYGTAQELAEELARFLRVEPVQAPLVGRLERAWRWCGRNPLVAASVTVAVIALLAGSVASTLYAMKAENKRAIAEQAQGELTEAIGKLLTKQQQLEESQG